MEQRKKWQKKYLACLGITEEDYKKQK